VETIFVLLPLALLIAAIAVGLFIWAARTGQFDDLDTPAVRMLFDDPPSPRPGDQDERGFGAASPPSNGPEDQDGRGFGAASPPSPGPRDEGQRRDGEAALPSPGPRDDGPGCGAADPARRVSG